MDPNSSPPERQASSQATMLRSKTKHIYLGQYFGCCFGCCKKHQHSVASKTCEYQRLEEQKRFCIGVITFLQTIMILFCLELLIARGRTFYCITFFTAPDSIGRYKLVKKTVTLLLKFFHDRRRCRLSYERDLNAKNIATFTSSPWIRWIVKSFG